MGGESQIVPLLPTHKEGFNVKLTYKNFKFNVDARRPLFVVVSGAHAYGTERADSDLDVRGVRMPTLEWAVSLARDERGVQHTEGNIDVSIHNVYHFLSVLLHGNGTFLENMFEPLLYEDPAFKSLRPLVMKYGVSKRFANHYYGFVRSSIKEYDKTKQIKKILYAYRSLLAGICLFQAGKVEYDLNVLIEKITAPFGTTFHWEHVKILLDKYQNESDILMPNEEPMPRVIPELNELIKVFGEPAQTDFKTCTFKLGRMITDSGFPDEPDYEPFNKWLLSDLLDEKERT